MNTTPSLRALWFEWQRLHYTTSQSDDEADAMGDRQSEIEQQMAITPARTLLELTYKLQAVESFLDGDTEGTLLLASARADIGTLIRNDDGRDIALVEGGVS